MSLSPSASPADTAVLAAPKPLHLIQGRHTFAAKEGFPLECGRRLRPVTLHYAMYGEPNAACDNVVLVCHALSGSAEVAEWWPEKQVEPWLGDRLRVGGGDQRRDAGEPAGFHAENCGGISRA